ncbi:MAG: protein kinase domain-containing protein [Planctomycetota bacterium]|jgi:serine/threonine protein kinase
MSGQKEDPFSEIRVDEILWEGGEFEDTIAESQAFSSDLRRTCTQCKSPLESSSHFCNACGAPVVAELPRVDPLAGTQGLLPDRYRVVQSLGRGGTGRVFLCKDLDLAVDVAVKVLAHEIVDHPDEIERMRQEARATAQFRECPGILSLYAFDLYKGTCYLVMEYAAGGSLRARLRREHRLSESECRRLGAEVAKGLAYAHRRDFVHRDIKPGNVLLDERWHAKIADFGIARALAQAATTGDSLVGTPAYVAPEIIAGEPVDGRADLYSLGCMLYEMATGELPFKGSFPEIAAAKVLTDRKPPNVSDVRPQLSNSFAGIVRCLLQRNPEQRYHDAMRCAVTLDASSVSLEMTPTVEPNLTETKNGILAAALFKRALKHQRQESYSTSESLLHRAIALHEELFGPQDPLVARDLKYLARNHYLRGEYEAAEEPFARAIKIRERALGENHPDVANDLTFMGRIYSLQGKYQEAQDVYARALRIMEKSVGREDPALVRLLNHLAAGHLKRGKPEKAGPLLDRALKIVEIVRGRGHPAATRTLNNLASLYLLVGNYRKCETTLNRALTILELSYGPDHLSMLDTLDLYAALLERGGKHEGAVGMRERAERIRDARPD